MRVEWDKTSDTAELYLVDGDIPFGGVAKTVCVDPSLVHSAMVNLDFDKNGILLAVQVDPATKVFPKELLDKAEIVG